MEKGLNNAILVHLFVDRYWIEAELKIGFRFKIKADSLFKPQAYMKYVEDLKSESNADIGLEDIFKKLLTLAKD